MRVNTARRCQDIPSRLAYPCRTLVWERCEITILKCNPFVVAWQRDAALESLDAFTLAYIEVMLWSTSDYNDGGNDCEHLDATYDYTDLSDSALAAIVADCTAFQATHGDAIDAAETPWRDNREQAGHDFWLTRNRHGCGFWDGDWPEPLATTLTDASHAFGELSPYSGKGLDGVMRIYL